MYYSDFTFEELEKILGLQFHFEHFAFSKIALQNYPLSEYFVEMIRDNTHLATFINTEKARAEFIIAPILAQALKFAPDCRLFSGTDFTVDIISGLTGYCDFILTISSYFIKIKSSVIIINTAKINGFTESIPKVVAEMLAAQIFNQQNGESDIETVYGIVTTGSVWKFLRIKEKEVFIDIDEYYINEVQKIINIIVYILESQKKLKNSHNGT